MTQARTNETSQGPLSRFTVLDLTRVRAGPTAVRQLTDWGARAIKIESPRPDGLSGKRHGSDFQNLQRNKRSIILDLKHPDGVKVLERLVAKADVVIENYRPDVKHRLGIDYAALSALNPRLVYASISGFGQEGPYKDRPGVDQIAQGMGGLMSITGLPGQGPVRVGIPVADLTAGLYCAFAILVALHEREVSGRGQWVHTSLLQAQIAMLDFQAARWLMDGEIPPQAGNDHPTSIPTGVFQCSDAPINIGASGGDLFQRMCRALDANEISEDPRYATEELCSKNRESLNQAIEAITRTGPAAHWVELLNGAGVPCGPVYTIDQVFADPQVKFLGMAQPVPHPVLGQIDLVGQPIGMSRTPSRLRSAAPEHGEHTHEVLAELGFSEPEIERLDALGVTKGIDA